MDIEFGGYKITEEPIGPRIPEFLSNQLQNLYEEIHNPKPKTIDKLLRLIKKYPNNLQLKNYLVTTYSILGREEDASSYNDAILRKHPDYLFALIRKADDYLIENKFDAIVDLLGKGIELQDMYPNRDEFHITEFLSLQLFAVKYFTQIDDLDQAQIRLEMMADVAEDSPHYQQARTIYKTAIFQKAHERFEREREKSITPINTFKPNEDYKFSGFELDETEKLYQYSHEIPIEFVERYLKFNREQLISDLEHVLQRSFINTDYGKDNYAPVHALFMLGELEAEESLPVVLETMRNGEKYFNDVFGNIFTEGGWIPLFRMAKNRLDLLEEYLKLPGVYIYFRASALDVLREVAYHYPDRKNEVAKIYKNLLDFYINQKPEDNVIDSEFNGFFVSDMVELRLQDLLPQIRKLYQMGYVSESVFGSLKDAEEDITKDNDDYKWELLSIKEFYERDFPRVLFGDDELLVPPIEPVKNSHLAKADSQPDYYVRDKEKVGRNDPCPCGSGKKFKKCCMGKGIFD